MHHGIINTFVWFGFCLLDRSDWHCIKLSDRFQRLQYLKWANTFYLGPCACVHFDFLSTSNKYRFCWAHCACSLSAAACRVSHIHMRRICWCPLCNYIYLLKKQPWNTEAAVACSWLCVTGLVRCMDHTVTSLVECLLFSLSLSGGPWDAQCT